MNVHVHAGTVVVCFGGVFFNHRNSDFIVPIAVPINFDLLKDVSGNLVSFNIQFQV